MALHRLADLLHAEPVTTVTVPVVASGFMACPLVLQAAGVLALQQQIYLWAFEQAQAVVRPSLLERWQTVSEN